MSETGGPMKTEKMPPGTKLYCEKCGASVTITGDEIMCPKCGNTAVNEWAPAGPTGQEDRKKALEKIGELI